MQKSESGVKNESVNSGSSLSTPPASTFMPTQEKSSIQERSEKELAFQCLLVKFHNAVWEAAEHGTDFDIAGNAEVKELIAMFNGVPPMDELQAVALILDGHHTAKENGRLTGTSNWAGDIWHAIKRGFAK